MYNTSDCTRCDEPTACAMTQVDLKTHCIKLVRCQEIRTTTSTSTTTKKPIEPKSTSNISVIIGIVVVLVLFLVSFVVVKKMLYNSQHSRADDFDEWFKCKLK